MVSEITPQELHTRLKAGEKFRLIDVREPNEYALIRLKDSVLIPMNSLPGRMGEIDSSVPAVFVCRSGSRSRIMAEMVAEDHTVYNLKGGIAAVYREGLDEMLAVDGDIKEYL